MVSIILVNYFHKKHLKNCIKSIKKNKGAFEIIIVNNSPRESLHRIARNYPEVEIIEANNLGFGGGCNLGAKKSRGKYLVFLNPDSIVNNNWLTEALKALKKQRVGIVMSKILSLDGKVVNSWGGEVHYTGFSWAGGFGRKNITSKEPYEVAFASGASFFISRKLFNKLGGFDSDFFMYVEDLDLSFRARLLGYKVLCAPRSIVFHDYEFDKGDYKFYYLERNRRFFVLKNYSTRMLWLALPAILFLDFVLWLYFIFIGKIRIEYRATHDFWKNYSKIIKKREKIKKNKTISDKEIFKFLSPKIESNAIDSFFIRYLLNPLFFIHFCILKFFLEK